MPAAVALMLEGMPSPRDLHLHRAAGRVVVLVGSKLVAEYGETDLAMRNMVIVTLRRLGFPGGRVAEVFGLTATYVSRLRTAAARQGAAALAGQDGPGRPRSLGEDQQDLARQWREQGESDLEIGRRLGVAGTTVARRLAARPAAGADAWLRQAELELAGPAPGPQPEPGPRAGSGQEEQQEEQPEEEEDEDESPVRGAAPAGAGRGGWAAAGPAAGAGRAADHRRGVLVAVCGGDAAARVHGPRRGGAGAGVRRHGRARRRGVPVRRCGAA